MKVTLHSTTAFVDHQGVRCRVWEGFNDIGVACFALIPVIAARSQDDNSEFERDLLEHLAPSADAVRAFDIRKVI